MVNVIRIKKASFYAYHGVMQEEQRVGGKFEADIDMYINFSEAGISDNLHKTINYETVYNYLLTTAMSKKSYLIERVAYKICEVLFDKYPNLERLIVRVRKNNPPIGGIVDCVEVEIDTYREEYFSTFRELNSVVKS